MNTAAKRKVLWVTWEKQIRNRSLSRELEVPLFEILSDKSRFGRYIACIKQTVAMLRCERPDVVVCQNPSLVLSFLLLRIRSLFGFKVVIDAHFGGVEAYNGNNLFQRILDHCNRSADLVIATNQNHGDYIKTLGGNAFICPDPLPDLSRFSSQKEDVSHKVFFICSFDQDEPFMEVFLAAEALHAEGFRFYVSGNYRKAGIVPEDFPHIELLGFVSEVEFYRHLFSSQVVIDLTDNENCLVCGAYEALEACKPLVLSNKKVLQEYFTGGTVFTTNNASEISKAVRRAHAEREKLSEECREWVLHAKTEMSHRLATLNNTLENL